MPEAEGSARLGAELIAAEIPHMPEEKRSHMQEAMVFYPDAKTPEDAWATMIHKNRQLAIDSFTAARLDSDVFNEVYGVLSEVQSIDPGESFKTPKPRTYRGYFKEKATGDDAVTEFVLKHSDQKAVEQFDTHITNIRNLMDSPATAESIAAIKGRLRDIYRLIYSREPEF